MRIERANRKIDDGILPEDDDMCAHKYNIHTRDKRYGYQRNKARLPAYRVWEGQRSIKSGMATATEQPCPSSDPSPVQQ
jgi:hypothetical protein